jgi:hypothetical protein
MEAVTLSSGNIIQIHRKWHAATGAPLNGTTDATRQQADFTIADRGKFLPIYFLCTLSIWFCWVSATTCEMNGLWCVMGS